MTETTIAKIDFQVESPLTSSNAGAMPKLLGLPRFFGRTGSRRPSILLPALLSLLLLVACAPASTNTTESPGTTDAAGKDIVSPQSALAAMERAGAELTAIRSSQTEAIQKKINFFSAENPDASSDAETAKQISSLHDIIYFQQRYYAGATAELEYLLKNKKQLFAAMRIIRRTDPSLIAKLDPRFKQVEFADFAVEGARRIARTRELLEFWLDQEEKWKTAFASGKHDWKPPLDEHGRFNYPPEPPEAPPMKPPIRLP